MLTELQDSSTADALNDTNIAAELYKKMLPHWDEEYPGFPGDSLGIGGKRYRKWMVAHDEAIQSWKRLRKLEAEEQP
jgi:hypothetical protein